MQYQADRKILGYRSPTTAITERSLRMRAATAKARGETADTAAFIAAFERLLAWVLSNEPEPLPDPPKGAEKQVVVVVRQTEEPPKEPTSEEVKQAKKETALAKKLWLAALNGRQARHDRRRSAYAAVAPTSATPSG